MFDVLKDHGLMLFLQLLKVSIPLTIISFSIGLTIAIFIAMMNLSSRRMLKVVGSFYVSIIRGTPLLVQLFIIFYGLPYIGILIDPYPAAVIGFSINIGAYASETIRGSILAIDVGQWEAAKTIGMNYWQTMRRIVIPQAARIAVPPLSNSIINLVKDTSLASIVLVPEMFRKAQEIAAVEAGNILPIYLLVAIFYWIIVIGMSKIQSKLEVHLNRYVGKNR